MGQWIALCIGGMGGLLMLLCAWLMRYGGVGPVITVVMLGLVLIGGGAWMSYSAIKAHVRDAGIRSEGQRVLAKIISVHEAGSPGYAPWIVEAQWIDPRTGKAHVYKSEELETHPKYKLKGGTVPVKLDPQDLSYGLVDVSGLRIEKPLKPSLPLRSWISEWRKHGFEILVLVVPTLLFSGVCIYLGMQEIIQSGPKNDEVVTLDRILPPLIVGGLIACAGIWLGALIMKDSALSAHIKKTGVQVQADVVGIEDIKVVARTKEKGIRTSYYWVIAARHPRDPSLHFVSERLSDKPAAVATVPVWVDRMNPRIYMMDTSAINAKQELHIR